MRQGGPNAPHHRASRRSASACTGRSRKPARQALQALRPCETSLCQIRKQRGEKGGVGAASEGVKSVWEGRQTPSPSSTAAQAEPSVERVQGEVDVHIRFLLLLEHCGVVLDLAQELVVGSPERARRELSYRGEFLLLGMAPQCNLRTLRWRDRATRGLGDAPCSTFAPPQRLRGMSAPLQLDLAAGHLIALCKSPRSILQGENTCVNAGWRRKSLQEEVGLADPRRSRLEDEDGEYRGGKGRCT